MKALAFASFVMGGIVVFCFLLLLPNFSDLPEVKGVNPKFFCISFYAFLASIIGMCIGFLCAFVQGFMRGSSFMFVPFFPATIVASISSICVTFLFAGTGIRVLIILCIAFYVLYEFIKWIARTFELQTRDAFVIFVSEFLAISLFMSSQVFF